MILDPVDILWYPYDTSNTKYNNEQVKHLIPTGCTTGPDGIEFVFVPTSKILEYDKLINTLVRNLKDYDTEDEICSEIFWSTKIEGSTTTYDRVKEIYHGDEASFHNYVSEKMVIGGFNARNYLNNLYRQMNISDMRAMWDFMVSGCCDNANIAGTLFRIGNVCVGTHIGSPYQILVDVMKGWCNYYNSKTFDEYHFIKACILHFSFAYIHPFCDGNGRSARLLMCNYLASRGYDFCQNMAFSRFIGSKVQSYYKSLELSENAYNDITPFIEFMMDCIYNAFYYVIC